MQTRNAVKDNSDEKAKTYAETAVDRALSESQRYRESTSDSQERSVSGLRDVSSIVGEVECEDRGGLDKSRIESVRSAQVERIKEAESVSGKTPLLEGSQEIASTEMEDLQNIRSDVLRNIADEQRRDPNNM